MNIPSSVPRFISEHATLKRGRISTNFQKIFRSESSKLSLPVIISSDFPQARMNEVNQSYFKEREGKQNRKEKGNRGVEASQIFKAFLLLLLASLNPRFSSASVTRSLIVHHRFTHVAYHGACPYSHSIPYNATLSLHRIYIEQCLLLIHAAITRAAQGDKFRETADQKIYRSAAKRGPGRHCSRCGEFTAAPRFRGGRKKLFRVHYRHDGSRLNDFFTYCFEIFEFFLHSLRKKLCIKRNINFVAIIKDWRKDS